MNNNKNIRLAYDYLRYLKETIRDENFVGRFATKTITPSNLQQNSSFNTIILVLYMDRNYVVFTYGCKDTEAKVLERENFKDWCLTQRQMISLQDAKDISENIVNELTEKLKKKGRR